MSIEHYASGKKTPPRKYRMIDAIELRAVAHLPRWVDDVRSQALSREQGSYPTKLNLNVCNYPPEYTRLMWIEQREANTETRKHCKQTTQWEYGRWREQSIFPRHPRQQEERKGQNVTTTWRKKESPACEVRYKAQQSSPSNLRSVLYTDCLPESLTVSWYWWAHGGWSLFRLDTARSQSWGH